MILLQKVMFLNRLATILFIALSLILSASFCGATPANKKAFSKYFGPHLAADLNSCAACHVRAEPDGAESLEDFPHNEFGKAIHALDGKLVDRLEKVLQQDADGDGVKNLDAILLGHNPVGSESKQGLVIDSTLLSQKQEAFAQVFEAVSVAAF